MSTTLVQLTDLHLYRDRNSQLAGINTWQTFEGVLSQLRAGDGFDQLVLTGDLAQDEAAETYAMLHEALGEWLPRCLLIPGNHDDPEALRHQFAAQFSHPRGLNFELRLPGWHLIGLDSHLPGDVRGRIGAAQMAWLRERLTAVTDAVLLFVHHPPVAINAAWLDSSRLCDGPELVALIEASPQVRLVCCGHVHQEFSARVGDAMLYTTPSTCVQFGARAERMFDTRAAGYRTLTLHPDGRYETAVQRLA